MLADDARQIPGNSYGAQKAAAELILADASRRGFLDAVSLRLPTVIVRPGRPNRAASSFFSAIVREPLLGLDAELPVRGRFRRLGRQPAPRRGLAAARRGRWTPRTMGLDRSINPPGISTTVAHLLQALEAGRAGRLGPGARRRGPGDRRHRRRPGRPHSSRCAPARSASARTSRSPEVVRAFIEDDLEATRAERGLAG